MSRNAFNELEREYNRNLELKEIARQERAMTIKRCQCGVTLIFPNTQHEYCPACRAIKNQEAAGKLAISILKERERL